MKKKIVHCIILFICLCNISFGEAYYAPDTQKNYSMENIEAFINSPSRDDLNAIEDEVIRYCEEVYLKASRRRDFTPEEVSTCGGFFETKKEQEMEYMRYMFHRRGLLD